MPAQSKKRSSRFGIFLLLVAAFGLVIFLAIFLAWSSIGGSEFSPNTFQLRTFTYSRVPGTMVRIASTQLGTPTPAAPTDVLKHLPTLQQKVAWHVTDLTGVRREVHPAKILLESLQQRNANGSNFWGAWSAEFPTLAARLWPIVQQAAFQELYFCIPELLSRAEDARTPDALELASNQVLAEAIKERCRLWRVQGDDAAVDEMLQWFSTLTIYSQEGKTIRSIQLLRDEAAKRRK